MFEFMYSPSICVFTKNQELDTELEVGFQAAGSHLFSLDLRFLVAYMKKKTKQKNKDICTPLNSFQTCIGNTAGLFNLIFFFLAEFLIVGRSSSGVIS